MGRDPLWAVRVGAPAPRRFCAADPERSGGSSQGGLCPPENQDNRVPGRPAGRSGGTAPLPPRRRPSPPPKLCRRNELSRIPPQWGGILYGQSEWARQRPGAFAPQIRSGAEDPRRAGSARPRIKITGSPAGPQAGREGLPPCRPGEGHRCRQSYAGGVNRQGSRPTGAGSFRLSKKHQQDRKHERLLPPQKTRASTSCKMPTPQGMDILRRQAHLAMKTMTLLGRTTICRPWTGRRLCSACQVSTARIQVMETGSSGRVMARSSHQALEAM